MEKGELEPQQQLRLKDILKKYPTKPTLVIKEHWDKRFSELKDFAEANSRLPKPSDRSEEEKSLYNWLKAQITRSNNGKLTRGQKARLKKLRVQYPYVKTVHYKLDWDERMEEVQQFAKTHKRLPWASGSQWEKTLHSWLKNQLRRRKKGRLDFRQQRLLSDLRAKYLT